MIDEILFAAGVILVYLATSFRILSVAILDRRLELILHKALSQKPWLTLFRILWPLGRSEILIILVVVLTAFKPTWGISAGVAYLVWSGIDRIIKRYFKRKRPFDQVRGIAMLQPHRPSDPSFPSGDAFHIWFLALVPIQIFHLTLLPALLLIFLAILVSLGRVSMGVHFPLDILAGMGLGLAAAGFAVWVESLVVYLSIGL